MSSLRNRLLRLLVGVSTRRSDMSDVAALRHWLDHDFARLVRPHPALRVEAARAHGVAAEWLDVGAGRDLTLLYLHGGGYVFGSMASHRNAVSHVAHATGSRALLVDYRRAPETAFPGALSDAAAAYMWLLATGHPPERIVVAGDSAGGGLATALLLRLRERRLPMPAGAVLLSPWVDLTQSGASVETNRATEPMLSRARLDAWARLYVGVGHDLRDPMASPLFGRFDGLPPLFVAASDNELLLSDAERLAERAEAAGVPVKRLIGSDMLHCWPLFAGLIPETAEALALIGAFVREATSAAAGVVRAAA
jgi:acetyl esterase/lipase